MKIDDILTLPFSDVISRLCVDSFQSRGEVTERDPKSYLEEYNGKRVRRTTSVDKRENKEVDVFSETEKDAEGNAIKTGTKPVFVAKIHTNIPKKIVRVANAFLFGGEMKVEVSDSNDASEYFKTLFVDQLKMKSVFSQFARTVMVETKSAMHFFPKIVNVNGKDEIQIGVRILSYENSDFYKHSNEFGDMDAFVRKYKAEGDDGKQHDYVWIQTATKEITAVSNSGTWELTEKPNPAGKITVVYAEQDAPEWEDIATSLDALEMRLSRLIDTNDYFSEPILKSYGDTALPTKNTVGKTIEYPVTVDEETGKMLHGDADYLVWQQSIESTKLEIDELKGEIHSGTSTPDISFENLKDIGAITGIGMKFMFMDAYIKSIEKMEIFGPAVQRAVSVVKALISNVAQKGYKTALDANNIKVTFRSILPDDLKEYIDILKAANGDKPINASETITALSPFTKDAVEEVKKINEEANAESQRSSMIGTTLQ